MVAGVDVRGGDDVDDEALEALLRGVYVGEGFTADAVARTAFAASAVRARGRLFTAFVDDRFCGVVVLVPSTSPARHLAAEGEAEIHLLAVDPQARGHGIGARLMVAAVDAARDDGLRQLVLWTQPTMRAAHRLYERLGWVRQPDLDFDKNGRRFWVMGRSLAR